MVNDLTKDELGVIHNLVQANMITFESVLNNPEELEIYLNSGKTKTKEEFVDFIEGLKIIILKVRKEIKTQ